jgi:AcrR family transcriptional regulator
MHDGTDTRSRLLAATETAIRELGWDAASAEAIRKRAGASNGSWVHAFKGGRMEAATLLFLEWHASLWDPMLASLNADARPSDRIFAAACTSLVNWMEQDHARARAYFVLRDVLIRQPAGNAVPSRFQNDEHQVAAWLKRLVAERCPSFPFCVPLVFGVVIAAARAWAESPEGPSLRDALDHLLAAAKPLDLAPRRRAKCAAEAKSGDLFARLS